MWKKHSKSQPLLSTLPPTVDVTQAINNILLDTLTLHLEVQQFRGTRGDNDFLRIQLKLMENLLELNETERHCQNSTEFENIKQTELKIKSCLSNLEINAAGGVKTTFQLGKRSSSVADVHSYQSHAEKDDELSEVGKVMYQIKKEISELERKLENHNASISSNNINVLEQKIVQLSDELENVEIDKASGLYKTRVDLLKSLVKCSGKLKKVRRKDSMPSCIDGPANCQANQLQKLGYEVEKQLHNFHGTTSETLQQNLENLLKQCKEELSKSTDEKVRQQYNELADKISKALITCNTDDVSNIPNDVELRQTKQNTSEDSRTSLELLNNRLSSLRDQISLMYNSKQLDHLSVVQISITDTTNTVPISSTDTKIRLAAFKLAWDDLVESLSSQELDTEALEEIAAELSNVQGDLATSIKRIKRFIRQMKRSSSEEYSESKIKMKSLIDDMQILRRKINCYSGVYGDQQFKEIKCEIESCVQKVHELVSSDVHVQLAKTKITSRLLEYLQLLEEKSVKL